MKHRNIIKTALLSSIALSGSAYASDGTITFNGAITASTCVVAVNGGSANGTVTLPTIATTQLSNPGDVAGATSFSLDVSACTFDAGVTGATGYFELGANVDPASGRLNNTGTASNVQLQLFLGENYVSKIAVGQTNQLQATPVSATGGSLEYGVEYYATGASGAGTVASSATYSLIYN